MLPAGDAPGGEHVDERGLADEIEIRQAESSTLHRRQAELRHRLVDQRRRNRARITVERPPEKGHQGDESCNRKKIAQPSGAAAIRCRRMQTRYRLYVQVIPGS